MFNLFNVWGCCWQTSWVCDLLTYIYVLYMSGTCTSRVNCNALSGRFVMVVLQGDGFRLWWRKHSEW